MKAQKVGVRALKAKRDVLVGKEADIIQVKTSLIIPYRIPYLTNIICFQFSSIDNIERFTHAGYIDKNLTYALPLRIQQMCFLSVLLGNWNINRL